MAEWRRLMGRYAEMTEAEIEALAGRAYELTDVAKEALSSEISRRRLTIPLIQAPPQPEDTIVETPAGELDLAELDLVSMDRIWDADEARRIQEILDQAGIVSFLGDENAPRVDSLRQSFETGIPLKIRRLDLERVHYALSRNPPEPRDREPEPDPEPGEAVYFCPKCNSADVVFLHLVQERPADGGATASKFSWRCDACGHRWKDDGVVQH